MVRLMPCGSAARLLMLALAGLIAVPGVGAAQQQPTPAQASAIRSACRADYQAHCASVPAGGSAALACLQQNAANVSAPCQQALAAVGGGGTTPAGSAAPAVSAPAAPAPTTPAPAAPPAPTPAPAAARPLSPAQEVMLVRRSCAVDYQTFCRGVPLGGGRAVGCLDANALRLSPGCRGALAAARGGP